MKKRNLLLMLLLAIGLPWAANAQTLTVHDASGTNKYVPFYGYFADGDQTNQMIYPATELADMNGKAITEMVFYWQEGDYYGDGYYYGVGTWTVSLGETTATTLSGLDNTTSLTPVFTGVLDEAGGLFDNTAYTLTIAFDDQYVYGGGNLLVQFSHTGTGEYEYYVFEGESVTGASYCYDRQRNFLPKTTFSYSTPSSCPKPTLSNTVTTTSTSATITWTPSNEGQTLFDIYWSTDDTAPTEATTPSAANQSGTSYTIGNLSPATQYHVWIRGNCGTASNPDISGGWTPKVSFLTDCDVISTFPYTQNFDSYTIGSAYTPSARTLPVCWSHINECTNSSYKYYPTIYYYSYTDYSNSTPNSLRFYSYYSSDPQDQYAILPEMANLSGLRIKLNARAYSTSYDATFHVGVMTDPTNPASFEEIASKTPTTTSYEPYTISFSGYTGTGTYIAIKMDKATSSYRGVFIDDIIVEEIPSCLEPSGLECTAVTTTTATLNWTAGGTETAWDIYVSTENVAPTNSTTPTVGATADKPATVPSLTAATKYYAWVRAHCSDSDQSPWVGGISFTTDCETVTTFPFVQDFNSLATNGEIPVCWDNTDGTTTNTNYKWCYYNGTGNGGTTGTGHNSTNCVRFESYNNSNGNTNFLKTPVMNLPAGKTMQLTFWYKKPVSGNDFSVYISTDGGATYTTALATALAQQTSWFEQEIILSDYVGTENVVIVFKGTSNYGNGNAYIYLDDVTIAEAPSCIKPSGLTCDSKTAHTATLSWTNGAEGQNAWQIAYSTTANFNPDEVTHVDVTTNPATIEGLTQSTTYYAYVRAYCGGTDYSAWCNNKVTFSTVAGNVTPTGLAVDASTITSSQATASWNAVAGNTLHEYYQIYWAEATVTSVPDEPAAPNLITNITATSQPITGLNPETSYKVWVRDICGDDGPSAWSSAVTFSTVAECQTPDGLAASNVTTNSATITWNTYGQTGFNLRYSTDGENWTTLTNVSSPCLLDGVLIANTAYQVQVQAACNTEAWSTVLSFRTECDAITITDSYSYTEDFEDPVTTAVYNTTTVAYLVMPYCWDNYTTNTSYAYARPHIIKESASYNYATSGQVLYFYGSGYGYAELPEFTNAINTLQISFKWATESDSNGSLTLGYITNEDNGTYNTFTAIGESFNASSASEHQMKSETVYLNAVPATATRLVFRWYYSSWYGANIDDIEVSLLPSCYPVGTLSAATDVTYNSAKLSWALVDDTQDEWTVQYATNATFTEGVGTETATTNTNYELTDLTPETHYWVRVKAACSTTDDWSNAVDFTTDVFCAVTGLTAGTTTQTTADLSWTGASDSYNIQYRTAAVPTTTQLFTEGFETYADESALEAVWTVIDLGDGSNTDELGLSEVSGNKVFRFSSYNVADDSNYSADDFDQYLISPELTKAGLLEFAYKSSSGTSDKFRVGYSSTTNDVSAFTWGAETNSASSWKTYSETMPEDAKYFAINYTAVYKYRLYIDDIAIYEVQDAGTWQNTTSETASKQLTGLAAGTKYDVQVQGVCGGNEGAWSTPIYSFNTLPFTKTIEAVGNDNWENGKGGYYLIASPLAEDVTPNAANGFIVGDYDLYYFSQTGDGEGNEWINFKDETLGGYTLTNGKGYLYASKEGTTLTFTGAPGTNGDVPLDNYDGNARFKGWNLIGNPFAQDAYITKDFYTLENSDTYTENTAGTAIHAMQGLLVVADNDEETLTFSTEAPAGSKVSKLNMNVSKDSNVVDHAIISFSEGHQLPKLQFRQNSTKVYLPKEGKDYAITSVEGQVGEVPVSFKAENNGTYSLSFTSEEVSFSYLHLIDNMTGNDVNLLQTPSYTFDARTSDYESRFRLVFATGSSANDDTFGFVNASGNFCIFGIEGEATVQVIDVLGHMLSSEQFSGSYERQLNVAPGVYMIRLIQGNDIRVQKMVVR